MALTVCLGIMAMASVLMVWGINRMVKNAQREYEEALQKNVPQE
ncbi:hypothetical protein [Haemophilus paracuniculus]|nr:hypothetical protein [Haemophilus paracuniculus]